MTTPVAKKPRAGQDQDDTDTVRFRAPREFIEELDEVAKSLGLTRSSFLRLAARKEMDRIYRERKDDR